jgi:hypothetical protein
VDLPRPPAGRGGRMVRAVPGRDGVTPRHLPDAPDIARTLGEGPRRRGAGGEGLLRQPRDPGGTGPARGRMESWQKWSFPCSPLSQDSTDPPGWRLVCKRRHISRFWLASGRIATRGPGHGQQPQCEVELTEVRTCGQHWWTLGFEATGPADLLRSRLEATAALVFAYALPGGAEPGPDESRSYAQWLGQRPRADSDAAPEDCPSDALKTDQLGTRESKVLRHPPTRSPES